MSAVWEDRLVLSVACDECGARSKPWSANPSRSSRPLIEIRGQLANRGWEVWAGDGRSSDYCPLCVERRSRPSVCLLSGKLRFEDRDAAEGQLAAFQQGQGHRERVPSRVYLCPDCVGWHLTAAPARPGNHS